MSRGRRFVFDGVMVDEAAARLFVDGRERSCSQRAFQLIVTMCESGGQVLTRQQVIDQLWPGGQVVSDEALTQIVFRARNCLDRYAERLVTVRGVGLRLDAAVREDDGEWVSSPLDTIATTGSAEPATAEPTTGARAVDTPMASNVPAVSEREPTTAARVETVAHDRNTTAARPFVSWRVVAPLLLLVLVAWATLRGGGIGFPRGVDDTLDQGYGLTIADAHAAHDETAQLLREGFAHEARGDRARARALLETVHENDTRTPLPALFLGLWAGGDGDMPSADRWLEQARERMKPIVSPLLTAMLRYVEAERGSSAQDVLRYAGAVLDQRPSAWQMRLARAHLLAVSDLREAALGELQKIEVTTLQHRKLAMTLADRASFGDVEGAEAIFATLQSTTTEQSTLYFLRGRFAWTKRDWPAAEAAFAQAEQAARRELRFDVEQRASVYRGAIAVQQGEIAQAIEQFDTVRRNMIEGRWLFSEIDIGLMLAQLHALNGDTIQMRAELANAQAALTRSRSFRYEELLAACRARLLPDTPMPEIPSDAGSALAPLLAGWAAWHAGDAIAARSHYESARRRALPISALHDETRLLAVTLGLPPEPAHRIDPPFRPMARLAVQLAVTRLQSGGEPAP